MLFKILFFGDIVGKAGRKAMAAVLPKMKKEYEPDLTMANAENLAHGIGITKKTMNEIIDAGVDFFTSGNHIWKKPEVYQIFEDLDAPLIRPANYPPQTPGRGEKLLNIGQVSVLVINLNGRVFMEEQLDCPFRKFDEVIKKYQDDKPDIIIVDFHAEATSEKTALGYYADGKIQALVGTHTHIPTSDQRILPKGTAYVTDIGMVGVKDSVIGVDKEVIIRKFLSERPLAHEIPEKGLCTVNAVFIEIDTDSKKAKNIKRVDQEIKV